jgi:uncharacterized membrane protein YhaH (DUF805 family)
MSGYLIDLFFSLKGRASRAEWLLGSAVIAALALGGVWLFNEGSFDESLNAAPEIPTMAAVLWAFLCLYAFAALSTKRLHAAGRSRWAAAALALPIALLVLGWGAGYFVAPLSVSPDTLVFWALVAASLPALLLCAGAREAA